jgi:hypothetical protein
MKALSLLALLSAVGLAITAVLNAELASLFFIGLGFCTIALGDYARERKPVSLAAVAPVSASNLPRAHIFRLAA